MFFQTCDSFFSLLACLFSKKISLHLTFVFLGKTFKVGNNSRCYLLVLVHHLQHAKLDLKLRSPREKQDVGGKAANDQ